MRDQYRITITILKTDLFSVVGHLSGLPLLTTEIDAIPALAKEPVETKGKNGDGHRRKHGPRGHRFVNRKEKPASYYVFSLWQESPNRQWRATEFSRRLMSEGYGESTGPSVVSNAAKAGLAHLHPTGEYTLSELGKSLSVEQCVNRLKDFRKSNRIIEYREI